MTPPPATRHQRISRNLLHLIQSYLDTQPIGEVFCAPFDVLLSEWDIVVPDLIYLSNERAHFLTSKNLQGPPDVLIENSFTQHSVPRQTVETSALRAGGCQRVLVGRS